jgi:ParB/RepB/Spo0J family partition protein
LTEACTLAAMRASLRHHGQLSPVCAFEYGGALELFDGFKRLRAARVLGLSALRAVVVAVDIVEATVHMRERHAGRGLTALEEAWIVRALYRDHGLSQGAIAARLRCHKSWVCRRLTLVEALDTSVQADVRLGLLAPRAAVLSQPAW